MRILWQRQTEPANSFEVFLQSSSCSFLLRNQIRHPSVSHFSRITARIIGFYGKSRDQVTYNNVNKNPFSWPPSHMAIMPVHSFRLAYIFYTSGDIRKNIGMYFILNSIFCDPPSNQEVKEIHNIISALRSESLRYTVDEYSLPVYVTGRNHIIVLSETVYTALQKYSERCFNTYNFVNSPARKIKSDSLQRDVKRAIQGNYVLLYLNNGYLKYHMLKGRSKKIVHIREEYFSITCGWFYRSFYDRSCHWSEEEEEYGDTLTLGYVAGSLFDLINVEILRRYNKNRFSGIMPGARFHRLKVLPRTEFTIRGITPVFRWYSPYTGRLINSFVCGLIAKDIWHEEEGLLDIIRIEIYFIGEVIKLHDYMKKLEERKLLHAIITSLLKDEFVTNSDNPNGLFPIITHLMFFRFQDHKFEQYVFT